MTDSLLPPEPLRVYIVDDDEGVRHSLAALLLAGGHDARPLASGAEFLAQADLDRPGCVLLDLRMDGMSGLQVFEALQQRGTVLKTVFLSAHGEVASAVAAVKQGAVDWLEKPCDEATLLAAVTKAAQLSHALAERTQRHKLLLERWNSLSPRQQEVARVLATGVSSKEAARTLALRNPERPIDPRTVDTHRSAIFLKLDIRSSHELGMLVEDLGLPDGPVRTH
ncbi:response regulator transcription factor [Acidovorax sp. M2(2025)]|uniref:response regulator transcription factor n=1 Tax=Acidovorax sp. M2(2025) TaxID=3411355 RepID=UPI003BF5D275